MRKRSILIVDPVRLGGYRPAAGEGVRTVRGLRPQEPLLLSRDAHQGRPIRTKFTGRHRPDRENRFYLIVYEYSKVIVPLHFVL